MKKYISVLFSLIFVFSFTFPFITSATNYVLLDKWGYTDPITKKLVSFNSETDCKTKAKLIIANTPTCVNNPTVFNTGAVDASGTYYFNETMTDGTKKTFSWLTLDICIKGKAAYLTENKNAILSACAQLDLTTNNDGVYTYDNKEETVASGSAIYTLLAPIGKLTQITTSDNIGSYFNIMFKIAIGLCAVLAVLMIVLGGVQYMGDESIFGKTEAKSQITKAILGLLIAIGSYALLNTINPAMLGKEGLSVKQVSAEIDAETENEPWSGSSIGDNSTLCPEGYTNVATYGSPSQINVCKSVSANLTKLLAAAKSANIIISGSGARTKAEQQALRVKHGCTDPSISSSKCTPPTARPGHSMHESGKAVDFTCGNQTMKAAGGANSACFKWLSANAKTYGFYNLASEVWHWSTTGR